MDKRIILIIIAFVLMAGGLFWLLFFAEKNGKIEIIQEKQEKLEEAELVNENVIVEVDNNNEIPEKTPQQIVEEYKEEQKKSVGTVIDQEKITGKAEEKESFDLGVVDSLVAFGFQKTSGERKIDTIVIHSSFNSLGGDQYDVEKIIAIYKSYGVAAHYIIGRDGTVYRLVKENDIAYHAGVSQVPDGRTNVNNFSIGIEMVGNYTDGYTEKQYSAASVLVEKIKNKYDIKYVLGHKDIAPGRKTDPWGFDWNRISK